MSRRALTRDLYDTLVSAYRLTPGNHSGAARAASCHRKTAKRTWDEGWLDQGHTWALPISVVLRNEGRAALVRAREIEERQRQAEDAQREKEAAEVKEALGQEANVLRLMRTDVLSAAAVVAELVPALRQFAAVLKREVLDERGQPLPAAQVKVTPLQASKILSTYSLMVQRIASAGEVTIQLGRLIRGESNLNVRDVREMTEAEAVEELRAAAEVLAEAEAAGLGSAPTGTELQ